MPTEDKCTLLKKNRKELIVNTIFCGILGIISGIILGNVLNSYLFSVIGTTLIAETIGLTVNISLLKENKTLKVNQKVETKEKEQPYFEKQTQEKKQMERILFEKPKVQMTLYGFQGVFYPIYFDLEEKQKFNEDCSSSMQLLHTISYMEEFAGKRNVIQIYDQKEIKNAKTYYITREEHSIVLFDEEKSRQMNSFEWMPLPENWEVINVINTYQEFQKRGVILEDNLEPNEEMLLNLKKEKK